VISTKIDREIKEPIYYNLFRTLVIIASEDIEKRRKELRKNT
jgi:hypothetical protein